MNQEEARQWIIRNWNNLSKEKMTEVVTRYFKKYTVDKERENVNTD